MHDTFGPYHLARLRALGVACQTLGIETAQGSSTYAWQRRDGAEGFERLTLFDVQDSRSLSYSVIREALHGAIEKFRPDVFFVPGWGSRAALAASAVATELDIPAVVMSDSTARDLPRSRRREMLKAAIVQGFDAAFVAGSPQGDYIVSLGMPVEAVVNGYDTVDNDHFFEKAAAARDEAEAVRTRFSLPQSYLLASARFVPCKNLDTLLDAYALYRSHGGRELMDLVILGDGPERRRLEAHRARHGLEDCIHFPGFLQYDDLPAYYGLADIFVHVSSIEPWGLVVNEAMAAELPVIVSRACGCAADLVDDGVTGWLVDHDDANTIAKRMEDLGAVGAELRRRMGEAGRQRISSFTPKTFAANAMIAAGLAQHRHRRWGAVGALARRVFLSAMGRVMPNA